MRLVVVTQQVDPASPVLGATVDKLRALAARVDELVVLADSAVEGALPENCSVRPFRASRRAGRGLRFETALARELARRPRPAAVLAHMCPIYAVLAAPLARPLGVDVFLWFTHWRKSRLLRAAERVSTKVLSVDERTFPLRSRKLVAIGHGIDVSGFQCVERPEREPSDAARARPHLPREGARDDPARGRARCRTWRSASSARPSRRRSGCTGSRSSGSSWSTVSSTGSTSAAPPRVTPSPRLYAQVDALVNDMRPGATDKVVYEAAATCLPVIASNPAFDSLLPEELRFVHGDVDGLAAAIRRLAGIDRNGTGRGLREIVLREHSVGVWADRVVALAR